MYYEVQGIIHNLWFESEEYIEEIVKETNSRRGPGLPVLLQNVYGMALVDCAGRIVRQAICQAGDGYDPDNYWICEALVKPLTAVEYAQLTTFEFAEATLDAPSLIPMPVGV